MPEAFELVLRDCRIDGPDAPVLDIAVSGGKIVAVGPALRGARSVDCAGACVSPAWVDSHVHLRSAATDAGVDPLAYGPGQGVGALVDAGSARPARLGDLLGGLPWVFALANADSHGIRRPPGTAPEVSCNATAAALEAFPGRAVGIKVQASASTLGETALDAIRNAIRAAEPRSVPLMVHVGNPPPALAEVCDLLRPGDVITHYAHGKPEGATLADGSPLPALRRAVERGVLLDVGHGRSSFAFRRFRDLLAAGIRPAIISTDLHATSARHPVVSLARTMSKALALGLPFREVVDAVTSTPALAFALHGYGQPVAAGAPARLTVFYLEDREVEVFDSEGERLVCRIWFQPLGCLLDGVWYAAETHV